MAVTSPINSPVSPRYEWSFRRVVWATLVFATVVFGFWLIYRFYHVVFTLLIAIVLGTMIRPIANWLYQRGLSRAGGVILVYVVLLVLVGGFLWLLFPVIFQQGATILGELPGYYENLRTALTNSPNQLIVRLGQLLPAVMPGLTPVQPIGQNAVSSAEQIWHYLIMVGDTIFRIIVILALTLYWALDGPRIIKTLLLLVPQAQRESISELISAMEERLGFYIGGQALLCLSIAALALVTYLLIGLPNALVLALAAGVMEAVPMLGPVLGAVPAALIALSIAPQKLLWVILGTIIIQQLENNLLVPRIMKSTVGVNPFVTLLALFAFGSLFGIPGALMAIPLAAMIQLALNHFVFKPATIELEASEGRNYASRLRYEAQDLIQDLRKQARHKKRGSDENIIQIEHVMDEIETITTDLDTLLAESNAADAE